MASMELTVVNFILQQKVLVTVPIELGASISSFLGPSSNLSLSNACIFNSCSLLNWIWDSSCISVSERTSRWSLTNFLRSDRQYYCWQFSKALEVAASHGNLHIVKWVFSHFSGCALPVKPVEAAAANGNLKVLQFLLDHDAGQPNTLLMGLDEDSKLLQEWNGSGNWVSWGGESLRRAVENGHSDVARWLFTYSPHELSEREIECVLQSALQAGDLEFAKLLLPSNKHIFEYVVDSPSIELIEIMLNAGYLQHRQNDAVVVIRNLAKMRRLDLMQRVAQIYDPPPVNDEVWLDYWQQSTLEAVKRGDLLMLQWLVKHPTGRELITQKTHVHNPLGYFTEAAERGRVSIVEYLHQEGIADDYDLALKIAASHGHLDVVKWLIVHMTNWEHIESLGLMDEAAINGHLDILKFFQDAEAANSIKSHIEPINACISPLFDLPHSQQDSVSMKFNRKTLCSKRAMDYAAANGHLKIVKWLHANRVEGCTTFAMDNAAANGYLDVVQWLHSNRTEGCTTEAMDGAAKEGHLEIVKWLKSNRSEGCTFKAIEMAIANGHLQLACWLRKHYPDHFPALVGKSICMDKGFDILLFLQVHYPHVFTIWFCSRIQRSILNDSDTNNYHIVEWMEKHYPNYEISGQINGN